MKRYRARYTPEAAERIRKFHPQVKREIREGIRELLISPLAGHTLQFELAGLRSYRVRTYRIIYRIHDDESCLDIVFVGPEDIAAREGGELSSHRWLEAFIES